VNPRRLLPYLAVFLVLLVTYLGLRWHQGHKQKQEERAKLIFDLKPDEISALTLKRDKAEIQLTRQDGAWKLVRPVQAKADNAVLGEMVKALARLKLERDLGPGDLKGFGLEPPALAVSFTAQGQARRLALGAAAPGNRGYYARRDDSPDILLIAAGARDSLDQRLEALRDKTLWTFNLTQVKSVKIRTGKSEVSLQKNGATWKWAGRPNFRIRADRVDRLLRHLKEARITGFPAPPKDLAAAGLAPRAKAEVTVTTPQGAQTLFIGARAQEGYYARVGTQGPVVQVGLPLPDEIARSIPLLEDRRLWSGAILDVHKVVWGVPGKTWTASKEKGSWKLSGPEKAELKQSNPRMEMALVNFQNLEYASLMTKAMAPGKEAFTLELFDAAGKPLFRLEELGKQDVTALAVRTKTGDAVVTAVVPEQKFKQWQEDLNRLTVPPPK